MQIEAIGPQVPVQIQMLEILVTKILKMNTLVNPFIKEEQINPLRNLILWKP